jgi:hypothetical protein
VTEKHERLTWSLLLCWQTNIFSASYRYQPISSRRNSISFCCYLHHQFFNRQRLRAGHYKIPAQQQALAVGSNFKQTLKILTIILTSLYFVPAFGQKLPQKNGAIEVKKINHRFLRNDDYELTKKITNKQSRPYSLSYFDTSGNLIEQAGYGKHHNTDLRLLDYVIVNKFDKNRITESIRYQTDYSKNISPESKTIYYYNDNNQLIKETNLDFQTDTLILEFQYEYDLNGNETKTIMSPTYYYKKNYDSSSKRTSLQQIHNDKLRWEYVYTYTDTTRIGNFKTYYNDGKDYTNQEVNIYRDGKIIQTQEIYSDSDRLASMTKYHYDQVGLLSKIEYYKSYSTDKVFRLESYIDIKVKAKCVLDKQQIKKLNDTIIDD